MTTIAYRNGVLAADTRSCNNGWVQPHGVEKLFRLPDGSVCGVTGAIADASDLIEWLALPAAKRPTCGDDCRVVHLKHDGSLRVYEGAGFFDLTDEWTAFGSGSPAAQAAMYMGADAVRAVEIASLLDASTGGRIVSMACEPARDV